MLVYSGRTFELVRKLNGHAGFVKGLVWDPVGQYLATQVSRTRPMHGLSCVYTSLIARLSLSQSDDNTLKVWRTDDWGLQATISAPFVDAPKATVVRPS